MRPSAAAMDSAISAASARFSRARYIAMRSALLRPVPGSFLRAFLSLSKDSLIFDRRAAEGAENSMPEPRRGPLEAA